VASGDDGNIPQNTLDNDLGTRWSASGDGQWIRYDLGAVGAIGRVDIAWYLGDTRIASFDVEVSSDTVTWTRVFAGQSSGQTLQPERYTFPTASGRYVRIVGHGNSTSAWNSITEVALYRATTQAAVAQVRFTPESATLVVGGMQQLVATLTDASGNGLTGRAVTWTSSNAAVATVSNSGLTMGVAPGGAAITATSEGKTASAAVLVNPVPVASVGVSPASASVVVGGTVPLTATPQDANGNPLSGRTVMWSSSNPLVASVNASGLVTGVANGSANVVATSEGQGGMATIDVTKLPASSVTVSPIAASVQVGATLRLTATLKQNDGVLTWSSSAPAVATVDGSGLVTAVAAGAATITATSGGKTGSAAITVSLVVASVIVSPASASVVAGGTAQLTATLKDWAGNVLAGHAVTWTSSNPAIATVSAAGLVTGVVAGSATITATSEGQSATAAINVANVPVASVVISPVTAVLLVGATVQLAATPLDAAGNVLAGRSVSWVSSAAAAAVSSSGLVTGLAAGAATITATSEGVSGTAALTIYAGTHIGSPDLEPGLLGRTDLVLFEDFEFADWETHWSKISHPENYTAVTTPWFQGNRGLEVRAPSGSHNGTSWDFTFAAEGLAEPDAIYLRYYVRFNDTWQKSGDGEIGKLPGFGGTYNRCGWGGDPGDGTCWSARMMNFDAGATNQVGFYTYHMDQGGSYGEHMRWSPLLERGRWYCVEAYVQLNSLSGGTANSDGVLRGWVDGALAMERTNLRFRNVSATRVEKIWWDIYIGGSWTADRNMAIHFDNVVVARQRIGCHSTP
jgi:uncharacterized protein YjdB